MLNIALLNESFAPQYDGVAICVQNYARVIHAAYGAPYVIVPEEKTRDITKFPYVVLEYPALRAAVADQYKVGIPMSPRFRKRLLDLPVDIVHSHTPFVSGLLGQRLALKRGLPHVSTFHSKYKDDINQRMTVGNEIPGEIVARYVAAFYRRCDAVWTVSHGTANTLREYGYDGEITIMPNGCDMPATFRDEDVRSALAHEYGLDASEPLLLFVGRMTYLKNIHLIIKALGALKRNGRAFSMLFVGSGEDAERITGLIKEQGLGKRVRLVGKVMDREKLRQIYCSSDLFVFPSVYDNAPLVVREAAACGCASLLIEGSNSSEGVIHGQNGILAQASVEDIALGISDALTQYDLSALGRNARRDIYISWDDVLREAVDAYRRILADWKPKQRDRSKTIIGDIDLLTEISDVISRM